MKKKSSRIAKHVEEEIGDVVVVDWKVRRVANVIFRQMEKTLATFSSIFTKVLVMQKVMDDPIVKDVIPNLTGLVKDVIMQRELLSRVAQSLSEVKRLSSIMKLAPKHAILTALMNDGSTTSLRQKAQLLKVHPRNIAMAIFHREFDAPPSSLLDSKRVQLC